MLLPIRAEGVSRSARLFDEVGQRFPGYKLTIDLPGRQAVIPQVRSPSFHFDIDPFRKECLVNGLGRGGRNSASQPPARGRNQGVRKEEAQATREPWIFS
jgi:3-isopropylmalate dehydratase small subunit